MKRPLSPWSSLRLRLPLLMSSLIAVVLFAVFGVVLGQIEQMLVRAGSDRAQAAADQLSSLLGQSATRGMNEMRHLAADPAVQSYLTQPSSDAAAARAVLTPLAVASQPPVELWTPAGVRVLVVEPARGKSVALDAAVPLRAGLTPFQLANNKTVFYAVVAEVKSGAATAGYLVVRRTLAAPQTTDTVNRLVGNGALVAIGQPMAGVWTNFSTTVAPPPIDATRSGVIEYRAATGERRLGAVSPVAGTPWAAWIEFPRDRLLAPAQAMRGRLTIIGLVAVALSAFLVSVVSARITTPLHDLTVATDEIAGGQYARRVRAGRRDEIGRLADAFNAMTERVEAAHQELESRVRERTAELDRFFSLSIDLLCIAGTDGRFHRVNPAWEEALGWSAEELTARPYLELVHPEDREATVVEAAGLADRGSGTARFENRYRAKDGSYRWFSWNSAAAVQQGLVYATARDITDEKRAAAALEQHVESLKVINQELESFSYSVSHDLRAPLRHIVGFASLLDKSVTAGLNEQDRRYLTTIIESATRMGRLIDDLLAFSRMGRAALDTRTVSLDAIVREAVEEVRRTTRPDTAWELNPLPSVVGDPSMLRLVFVNLLSNAAKYSSHQAHPVIEVNLGESEPDDTVVYVRDNGVGFDMAYVDKLFGVFQRLHSADEFEGTGIGLANVRRIVHRHGGRVWAEGEVNRGATFYVSLPKGGRRDHRVEADRPGRGQRERRRADAERAPRESHCQ